MNIRKSAMAFLLLAAVGVAAAAPAAQGQPPAADRLQWFREAKFGLFIHWGVYSMIGREEWARQILQIRTSAKIACLAADGKLAEGQAWVQESILGSTFTGRYAMRGGAVVPSITGTAFVTAESTLILDDADPFIWGIRG